MRNRLVKRERWGENVDMTVVCADHDAVAANRRIVFRRCWEIRKPRCAARPDGESLAILAAPHAPPRARPAVASTRPTAAMVSESLVLV